MCWCVTRVSAPGGGGSSFRSMTPSLLPSGPPNGVSLFLFLFLFFFTFLVRFQGNRWRGWLAGAGAATLLCCPFPPQRQQGPARSGNTRVWGGQMFLRPVPFSSERRKKKKFEKGGRRWVGPRLFFLFFFVFPLSFYCFLPPPRLFFSPFLYGFDLV